MLLERACGSVEQTTGLKLWPTYSYFRLCQRGQLLKAHRDRPSREVSMTVNLGMDADEPWPIWIAGRWVRPRCRWTPGMGSSTVDAIAIPGANLSLEIIWRSCSYTTSIKTGPTQNGSSTSVLVSRWTAPVFEEAPTL